MRKSLNPKFQLVDHNMATISNMYRITQFLVAEKVMNAHGLICLRPISTNHCNVIPMVPMDIKTGDNDKPTTMAIIHVMSNQWCMLFFGVMEALKSSCNLWTILQVIFSPRDHNE